MEPCINLLFLATDTWLLRSLESPCIYFLSPGLLVPSMPGTEGKSRHIEIGRAAIGPFHWQSLLPFPLGEGLGMGSKSGPHS
jgi:hypothetical protein